MAVPIAAKSDMKRFAKFKVMDSLTEEDAHGEAKHWMTHMVKTNTGLRAHAPATPAAPQPPTT